MFRVWIIIATLVYGTFVSTGQNLIADCPKPEIAGPQGMTRHDERMSFSIKGPVNLSYEWKVSQGQILRGQGTPSIEVDTKNVKFEPFKNAIKVVVEVKVRGLPEHCVSTVSDSFGVYVIADVFALDDYTDISLKEEAARLDNLVIQRQRNKDQIAYIVFYEKPANISAIQKQRVPRIRQLLFRKRKEPMDGYVMLLVPTTERTRTELWLWPRDPRADRFPALSEIGVRVIPNK